MMNRHPFSLQHDDMQWLALPAGHFTTVSRFVFGDPDPAALDSELAAFNLDRNAIPMPVTAYALRLAGQTILLDMGMRPIDSQMPSLLMGQGIDPASVDLVLISHAHSDHIGGMVDKDGRLTYPNARYIITRPEWEFWQQPDLDLGEQMAPMVTFAQRHLPLIKDRVEVVAMDADVLPGLQLVPAPGHTPGHVCVRVEQGERSWLYVADLFLHPLHLNRPDWTGIPDLVGPQVAESRRALLSTLAGSDTEVLTCHFPFPAIGYLASEEGTHAWQPITLPD
jgi:glyoxylase-like metal-dependent hydrolase (beta-lactamase superfamily II)